MLSLTPSLCPPSFPLPHVSLSLSAAVLVYPPKTPKERYDQYMMK
jgi:hypothetical protein